MQVLTLPCNSAVHDNNHNIESIMCPLYNYSIIIGLGMISGYSVWGSNWVIMISIFVWSIGQKQCNI